MRTALAPGPERITAMTPHPALSNVSDVQVVAERLLGIADLLHRFLKDRAISNGTLWPLTDLYRLLIEEYGLRARAKLLCNDSAAYVVDNATTEQARLVAVLDLASETIVRLNHIAQFRSLIAVMTTMCVGFSTGKGCVVDFLVRELDEQLQDMNLA